MSDQEVSVEPAAADEKTETKEVKGTKRAAEVSKIIDILKIDLSVKFAL
jgi:hypothetical protein